MFCGKERAKAKGTHESRSVIKKRKHENVRGNMKMF